MEKLIELLQQIQELAGVAIDTLEGATQGDKASDDGGGGGRGGPPPEGGGQGGPPPEQPPAG